MRRFALATVWLCAISGAAYAQTTLQLQGAAAPRAAGEKGSSTIASYGIGMNIGRGLKQDGLQVSLESLVQGIRDGMEGAQPKYPEEQLKAAFETLRQEMQAKQQEQGQAQGEKNKREGAAFLAQNKSQPGVKTLPSGLQYQVIRPGTGLSPKATDTVEVNYEGKLLDGTVFDSSYKRGKPAEFQVDGVIPGWTEALQLMKAGEKWRLFIPSDLAYGARGAGGVIGPNAVLTFDVELLNVKPGAK